MLKATSALVLLPLIYAGPALAEETPPRAPAEGTAAPTAAAQTPTVEPRAEPSPEPVNAKSTEPAPAATAIPEKMQIAVPEALPSIARTYHVHRGFYLGVQAGIGFNSGTYDDNDPSDDDLSADGFNLALDLMVGGSPTPGLAVGGALLSDFLLSASFERDGFKETESSSMSRLLGVFVDGFPDAHGPFHVGGALGASHVAAKDVTYDNKTLSTFGIGYAAWVGYAPWVSDNFSLGASIRYMSNFSDISQDKSAATHSINLLFNAIYF
jgi:hypothetical protein